MDFYGFLWISMDFCGFLWISMDLPVDLCDLFLGEITPEQRKLVMIHDIAMT